MVGIRERKQIATRGRIVEEAVVLFAARGLPAVTVEEIAAAADVGKGTIYNYFASKEDIVVAFLIEVDRPTLAALPAIAADAADATEALDAAAWSLLENKASYLAFVKAFLARLFAVEGFASELGQFQEGLDQGLGAFFERLLARDDVSSGRSRGELILSFKTLQFGLTALWALEGPPFAAARAMTRTHMASFARGLTT